MTTMIAGDGSKYPICMQVSENSVLLQAIEGYGSICLVAGAGFEPAAFRL